MSRPPPDTSSAHFHAPPSIAFPDAPGSCYNFGMKFQTALALVVVVGSLPAACTPVENKESTADDSAGRDTGEKDPGGNDGWYRDDDGDGFLGEMEDCDDTNAAVNPDAPEDCGNQIDDDCDGNIDSADADCTAGAQRQGLDWSRLAFCAPDGQPAGMRSYRNQSSPFLPG